LKPRKLLLAAVMVAGLLAAPALAQKNEPPSGPVAAEQTGNSGAEPAKLLILQWINFGILVGVLWWLSAKYGGPYFSARAKGISEGLAAGERAKAEAAERARNVEARLANLQNEIGDLRSKAREEREREADRIRRSTEAEIARIRTHAEQELESAGKQARLDVQRFTAKLAIELAEQKLRAGMSREVQAALVDSFVSDLQDGAARAQTS
jgi:F-type H+-transporting ATPase subunit b